MSELRIQQLAFAYDAQPILADVSFEARSSELIAVLGPNGAGKTTLLRCLARVLRPTRGRVFLKETDIWQLTPRDFARRVALCPQSEGRDWPLSVREAVLLGRVPHRGWLAPFRSEDQQCADASMRRLDLHALADRPITQLSGGEWRRVVLARALTQRPEILLLDEPCAQLDIKHQLEIMAHLRELAERDGLTILLTMHDLNLAAQFATRMIILSAGRIVAEGKPRDVLKADILRTVYGIRAEVTTHPVLDTPWIVPLEVA